MYTRGAPLAGTGGYVHGWWSLNCPIRHKLRLEGLAAHERVLVCRGALEAQFVPDHDNC